MALFPCNECSKVIIQSGIKEVVYLNDFYHDTDSCKASRIMFKMAGVRLRRYKPENEEIVIDFKSSWMEIRWESVKASKMHRRISFLRLCKRRSRFYNE